MAYERFRNISAICNVFAMLLVRQSHLLLRSHFVPPAMPLRQYLGQLRKYFVENVGT